MAEQFARQNKDSNSTALNEAKDISSALGLLTTKDMLGSGTASEALYITELSRNLAEFLTDDRKGVLRREGGSCHWSISGRFSTGCETA